MFSFEFERNGLTFDVSGAFDEDEKETWFEIDKIMLGDHDLTEVLESSIYRDIEKAAFKKVRKIFKRGV